MFLAADRSLTKNALLSHGHWGVTSESWTQGTTWFLQQGRREQRMPAPPSPQECSEWFPPDWGLQSSNTTHSAALFIPLPSNWHLLMPDDANNGEILNWGSEVWEQGAGLAGQEAVGDPAEETLIMRQLLSLEFHRRQQNHPWLCSQQHWYQVIGLALVSPSDGSENQCPPLCLPCLRGFVQIGRHSEKRDAKIWSHAMLNREGLGAHGHSGGLGSWRSSHE